MRRAGPDVRMLVLQPIQAATGILRRPRLSDAGIHSLRRDIKRARAGLRLLRQALGKTEYRRVNAALRDVAGAWRRARDVKVLLDSSGRLAQTAAMRQALRPLRRELMLELAGVRRRSGVLPRKAGATVLQAVAQRLRGASGARSRAAQDGLNEAVLSGLRHTYKKSRKAFHAARRLGGDALWHECRKQAKYLLNQLEILKIAGRRAPERRRDQARQLAELLGEDHDLALLRERISGVQNPVQRQSVLKKIDSRRENLRRRSQRIGIKLYEERPREFALH